MSLMTARTGKEMERGKSNLEEKGGKGRHLDKHMRKAKNGGVGNKGRGKSRDSY